MDRLGPNDIDVKQKSTTSIHKSTMDLNKVAERFKELRYYLSLKEANTDELADVL